MEKLSASLEVNRQRLAQTLRWPENIGIEMREIQWGDGPPLHGLLVFVDGMASGEALTDSVLKALQTRNADGPQAIARALPLQRIEPTQNYELAVGRVLAGWSLLLVDGSASALLLDTQARQQPLAVRRTVMGKGEVFSRDLRVNVALLRTRLRSANLRALPVPKAPERAGSVALVYVEGKASPAVVRAVRRWASAHACEEETALGALNRASTVYGLLPRFGGTPWVDKAATMVDMGYVVLLVDRVEAGYITPVTLAGWLTAPNDHGLMVPVRGWLLRTRTYFALSVLLLPGAVVSLLDYHPEMIPTAFLLAIGSARESAPFGILFEVLLLELLTDVARGASSLLPVPLPAGIMMVTVTLITLTAMQTGFVGPLPALAAVIGALLALAIPSPSAGYLVRLWRYAFVVAGTILGFFGMATVFAVLTAYLSRATTWGVPFLGPSGPHFTAPESNASERPQRKGGKRGGKGKALVR